MTAIVFFLIFVALRGAFPAVPSAGAPVESYEAGGGASMGFGQAIATCFRKYAVFRGRASRSEYWFFVLFEILVYIVLMIADIIAFRGSMNVFSTLASLVLFLPALAVLVRRLHDTDRSAWWILIPFVPIIGSIWLIVLLCAVGCVLLIASALGFSLPLTLGVVGHEGSTLLVCLNGLRLLVFGADGSANKSNPSV